MSTKGFVSDKFIFAAALTAGSTGNVVEFHYNDMTSKGDIEDVKPGCGCTAEIEILDDMVRAKYNDNTPIGSFEGKGSSHHIPIERAITVFFKDGKPLQITDKGKKKYNPEKSKVTLRFYGNVKNT